VTARFTLAVALLLTACDDATPTEVVLEVSTDVVGASAVRVTVLRDGDAPLESSADLGPEAAPARLTLRYRDGALGPVEARVEVLGDAAPRSVRRRFAFQPGRRLTLRVFVAEACPACPGTSTCLDDGSCGSAEVSPCVLAGDCTDGGVPDGAAACPLLEACAIPEDALPGDAFTPCPGVPDVVVRIAGSGTVEGTQVRLGATGQAQVTASLPSLPGCAIEGVVTVAAPVLLEAGDAALRGLAARGDLAFAASDAGPLALEEGRWRDLREDVGEGGPPEDLRAVAVLGDDPVFGPARGVGLYRAVLGGTTAIGFEVIPLPVAPPLEVRAMAEGDAAIAVASSDGAFVLGAASAQPVAGVGDLGEDGGLTLAAAPTVIGDLFIWGPDDLRNVSSAGRDPLAGGGEPLAAPEALRPLAAVLYAASGLWLCGDGGLHRYDVEDLEAEIEGLPDPAMRLLIVCHDLAAAPDGTVWVAAGDMGLQRVDGAGAIVLRLSSEAPIDLVAASRDGRQVVGASAEDGAGLSLRRP
jgi:hypothetical protein